MAAVDTQLIIGECYLATCRETGQPLEIEFMGNDQFQVVSGMAEDDILNTEEVYNLREM